MKLLFIAESYPTSAQADLTGGVEARDFYTASRLAQNHQVTVITGSRKGYSSHQNINGVTVIRVGLATTHTKRESLPARLSFSFLALPAALRQNFDLIQGSNVITEAITYLVAALKNKPAVAVIPDIYIGSWIKNTNLITGLVGEFIESIVITRPWDLIISWSGTTKDKLILYRANPKIIKVIGAGVDTAAIAALKAPKFSRPTITFAARLVKYKRAQDLIYAINILKDDIPDIQAKIIGIGPELDQLRQLRHQLKLADSVEFLGFIKKHQDVTKTIKQSHLFCLPSVVEGFGLVTIEALACSVPYVNSRIPSTLEVTHHSKGGLLFNPKSPQDLAQQAKKLLTDPKLYQSKQQEGQELIRHYSWDKVVRQTEKAFQALL